MRVMTTGLLGLLACTCLFTAGCQRLNDQRTVEVSPLEEQMLTIDAPRRDQKVNVDLSSPGAPVNAYLFLEKDSSAVRQAVNNGQKSDKVLAGQEKAEQANLQATVPAGNAFVILLTSASAKKATVNIKITGK